MFEEHGEIKTFFDLIANRGMVFVTYVGLLQRLGVKGELNSLFSMISERRRELASVCKGQRSAADR